MNWLAAPGRILVRDGGRVLTYDRTARPGDLVAAYADMLRCAGFMVSEARSAESNPMIRKGPKLECVEDLGGAGGRYVDGLILIGLVDAQRLANSIGILPAFVAGRLLAHELGHALRRAGAWAPYDREEDAADFLAGSLDGMRRKDPRLGALVFRALGARGDATHSDADARERVYLEGFRRTG